MSGLDAHSEPRKLVRRYLRRLGRLWRKIFYANLGRTLIPTNSGCSSNSALAAVIRTRMASLLREDPL